MILFTDCSNDMVTYNTILGGDNSLTSTVVTDLKDRNYIKIEIIAAKTKIFCTKNYI